MKTLFSTLAIAAILCFVSSSHAQRPDGGRRGGPPPQRGADQGQRGNQAGGNQARGNQGGGDQAGGNQNGNQNRPSAQQLAQMMIANFDADGSGELGLAELESALQALDQHMKSQGNGPNGNGQNQGNQGNQNQAGPPRDGAGNQQGPPPRGAQNQGNRPQRGGQANARRGR